MKKFTDGPWGVCPLYVEHEGYITLFIVRDEDAIQNLIAWVGYGNSDTPKVEANARLIAAAPEMYDLLVSVATNLPYEGNSALIDKIGDLLARIDDEEDTVS